MQLFVERYRPDGVLANRPVDISYDAIMLHFRKSSQ